MYKVGITGTRSGMNDTQLIHVRSRLNVIIEYYDIAQFHHGDCVGVDFEAANIAMDEGYEIVCHPPIKEDLRAFHNSDEFREPLSYFARNRNIVDESNILFVVPYLNKWEGKGGTDYTFHYAKKIGKETIIFWPDGRIE